MEERLQKYMARCGVASRRASEELILGGKVRVNDEVVVQLGYKIDNLKDKVYVDSRLIEPEEKKVYIALNKPTGYISSVKDEKDRKTVLDIVKVEERIYPIGRLDYDTSGLLLLTNDGEVYNKIIHPRQAINKVYIAKIKGIPKDSEIKKFCSGVDIGGYVTAQAEFSVLRKFDENCEVEIVIHEGKNRQVRKMCDTIGHPVISLRRLSVGNISANGLNIGCWRYLSNEEINYLKNL